ncbi:MAG: hypothetical protein ACU0B9_04065 [Limimaricola soesokkakensis]|uniref:hypothetical protein n=1 Tax=Limimaricola soesokkakensis TaxID=1343159 RepID=UPI004059BED2
MTGARRLFRFLSRRHPVAALLLALAVAAGLGFGWQVGTATTRLFAPTHAERPIEPWMTPRYVARSWGLPPSFVFSLLPADPHARPHEGPMILSDVLGDGPELERFRHRIEAARAEIEGASQ